MTKEFLNEKNLQEVAAAFDEELAEYVKQVNSVNDVEKLKKMEEEVIKEQDDVNVYLKDLKYELPKEVAFDGNIYSLSQISAKIIYFLNKKEVEWKYTYGLYELVKFWKTNNPTEITYGAYDSTLRLLNQVSFRGFIEWKDILVVNEYMKYSHERYSKDTSWVIFCSEKHNAIMDRMKQLNDLDNEVDVPEIKTSSLD